MNSSQPADSEMEVGLQRRSMPAARDSSISRPISVAALLFSITLVNALIAATATASWPSPASARWKTSTTAERDVVVMSVERAVAARVDAPRSESSSTGCRDAAWSSIARKRSCWTRTLCWRVMVQACSMPMAQQAIAGSHRGRRAAESDNERSTDASTFELHSKDLFFSGHSNTRVLHVSPPARRLVVLVHPAVRAQDAKKYI